jgi:hypothetical protein
MEIQAMECEERRKPESVPEDYDDDDLGEELENDDNFGEEDDTELLR